MSDSTLPLVSVSMVAYNVEKFIGEAIEGVLMQQTDFPIELVIGEDCSTDDTRAICAQYAAKYPSIIRLHFREKNLGMGRNHYETLKNCQGTYIAVCDSDDVWTDPYKLAYQVDFLERNPDYGIVYTDIECIDEHGNFTERESMAAFRHLYQEGDIFFQLLQASFLNNCTTLFRRSLIDDYQGYFINIANDYLLWMRLSMRTKVHFYNKVTAHYRIHSGSITNSAERVKKNQQQFMPFLQEILLDFDRTNTKPLTTAEKTIFFRKAVSMAYRATTWQRRQQMLALLPKYFPGFNNTIKLFTGKLQRYLSHLSPRTNEVPSSH